MYKTPPFLLNLLHICEFVAIASGIFRFKAVKNSFWKWFLFYLIYILCYETISTYSKYKLHLEIGAVMSYIQIPIEFVFLYWLYAYQSLQNKKLFWGFTILFLTSLCLECVLNTSNFTFRSLNNTVGTFLLLILVFLEFNKQIKSDEILIFKENKMFYINLGVTLFYIGNMPFFALYFPILKEPTIWNNYYIYFMISNCIMYLLFAASFIWGKQK